MTRTHKVRLFTLAPFQFPPRPVARYGFVNAENDSGYIMFYRSPAEAREGVARWDAQHEQAICIPLGHTLSWCLKHMPVPGVKQVKGNVFIDWGVGPRNAASRSLIENCLLRSYSTA